MSSSARLVESQHPKYNNPDEIMRVQQEKFQQPASCTVAISKRDVIITWAMPHNVALQVSLENLMGCKELARQRGPSATEGQIKQWALDRENFDRSLTMDRLLHCCVTALQLPVVYIWSANSAEELMDMVKQYNRSLKEQGIKPEVVKSTTEFVGGHFLAPLSAIYSIKMQRGNGNEDLLVPYRQLYDTFNMQHARARGDQDLRPYTRVQVLAGFIQLLYREQMQEVHDSLHFGHCIADVHFCDYRTTPPIRMSAPTVAPNAPLDNSQVAVGPHPNLLPSGSSVADLEEAKAEQA